MIRLPYVLATTRKAERLEAHRLKGDVAGEDHQVSPGDFPAVLLLDRPEQASRLLEVRVIRPAVERRKALLTSPTATAAVTGPVGARAVPCHADEQRSVVTEVRRPPVLRVGHQRREVLLHGSQIEGVELLGRS